MADHDASNNNDFFHELVARAACREPGATAVEEGAQSITFGELNSQANRLARHLADFGVQPGARVGVCLPRGGANLLAQLAVLKLGAAVLLLDPEYPEARLTFMLDNAEAAAVVGSRESLGRIALDQFFPAIAVDDESWQATPEIERVGPVDDDTVCHVAYTSGSTGEPKAVLFRHGPLRTLISTLIDQCGITPGDRGSWLCSPGVGLVQVDCLPVIAAGGTVCIGSSDVAASVEGLRDWLVEHCITHSLLLTATAERCWSLTWPADAALRNVRVAGERMRRWPAADLPFEVVNVYGSSEATVVTTGNLTAIARTLTEDERAHRAPPVGRPVPGVRVHVLDEELRPVPAGTRGELFVSGVSLSKGYLNRPEANSEKFLANPVSDDPNPVLYRTGDIARCWADGTIEIIGRTDDQVKIRGHRVHLGEVESALATQPGVRQAAVGTFERVLGERKLVGYLVADPAAPPLLAELRKVLRQQLPQHMLPAALMIVDRLPISANGKVDRDALPPPPETRPDLDVPLVEPRDAQERELAELWRDVLAVDEVGVLDNFFDLGGDSLSAIRLLRRVAEELGTELGLTELVESPSVAQLARKLATDRTSAASGAALATLPTIRPDAEQRFEPFPLTETQQALWIGRGSAVDFGDVGCHGYFEWERTGLEIDRFRTAWAKLKARHDMLRCTFLPDGTQRIRPHTAVADEASDVRVEDLRELSAEQADLAALRTREEMSHQVLDPGSGHLYDVRLSVFADGRTRLHLSIDLLIMDAWSAFQVLFPDLIEFYENPDAELPELEIGFRDYVNQSRGALHDSEAYRRSREYWLSRLPNLPAAPDLPQVSTPRGELKFARHAHRLLPATWKRLTERAKQIGVTPSGILVAAFAEVLRTWSKNDRFTINFPIFDRLPMHPQVEELLGDFTNTLLVAVEKTDGTFAQRAADIQQQLWSDLEHRHFNGVQVLRELTRQRQLASARPAMPIVVTSLLGHPPRRQVSALGEEIYGISQTPQVLLDFQIREIDGILHFKWDFLDAMFPPGLVDAMFTAYRDLIHQLADDESAWQREVFDLLPVDQLAQRAAVNRTDVELPDRLLHEVIAERAAAQPGAPAVITADRTMSYADLSEAANRIGRGLREFGVRPNELVAIVAEKGWEQYAAVYGILTSGAAYLPIDPCVPRERLRFLLTDGAVRVVITQSSLAESLDWPDGITVRTVEDFAEESAQPLASVQSATDLAYVIYTSGSTGKPKGVMVDHRGVLNMFTDINTRFGIGPADRVFGISGLHFDASIYDVFGILAAGGAVVLPEPSARPDPAAWLAQIRAESVTFWNSVPALAQLLTEQAEHDTTTLPELRIVVMAGDWIPLNLPERLRTIAPDVQVVGSGGPTETICWSVLYPIGAIDPEWTSIPYGKPMANHRYHILDRRWQHRPVWVPGQMVVASDVGLAHGYWHDEERTRNQFFRLPSTGERVYATGDIGRYRPDGTIEILGRDDFQVQVNGHRIELGELESAAESHPDVLGCVAVAPETANGSRRLTGFLVGSVDVDALRSFLSERLPGYLVPADLRVLAEFPLTRNGKVDRLALTAQAAEVPTTTGVTASEFGPLTALISGVCAELLELPELGEHDDFFRLGGDSLTGTRFVNRLNELFDVELSLRDVFSAPTCAGLAKALAADPRHGHRVVEFAESIAELAEADAA